MKKKDNGRSPPGESIPVEAPRTFGATLLRLGPGMIIAGSIVGSGELIATTKAGARQDFGFYGSSSSAA